MWRVLPVAVLLALFSTNPGWTQDKKTDKDDGPKDDLPYKDKIVWDVKLFEEAAQITVVKRTVDKDQKKVVWMFEFKDDEAAGSFIAFGGSFNRYFFRFYDEDKVSIVDVL